MLITEVHTGKTTDQSRKAILVVNDAVTQPGQLAALTEFLRAKGLTANPGYDEGHVLRVSNFTSDATLRYLLIEEFPATNGMKLDGKNKKQQFIDPHIAFIPLDHSEKQPFQFKRFISQYSTPLAGGLSLVSAISLFAKDLSRFRYPENAAGKLKSGITGAAAVCFATGSVFLTTLGVLAARKPSVAELIASLEPKLDQDPAKFAPPKPTFWHRVRNYALNNPWKVNTVFNSIGAVTKFVGHGIPSKQMSHNPFTMKLNTYVGPERMELAATTSALASLSLIATTPSGRHNSILGMPTFPTSRAASDPLDTQYGKAGESYPATLDVSQAQAKHGFSHMRAAGMLSFASNAGFGLKGLLDVSTGFRSNDEVANRARKSWPMMLILPLDLTASYLTTLAKPHFSYSLDDIATEAAATIARKLDLGHADPALVTRQTYMLSELLGNNPRVTQTPHQLREAIAARLKLDHHYDLPSQGDGLAEYQHMLETSPFSTPPLPEPILEKQKTNFAERVKKQAIAPAHQMA